MATLTSFPRRRRPPRPWRGPTLARLALSLAMALLGRARAAEPAPAPEVDVILWFDTEDYLLPADDDAAKRLAELLSDRGIRATFKVVGEKARVLEQRGRADVIAALKRHEIGYHSNLHSVHPTPTEYLADCGLLDGMAEFTRRESRGASDVRRVFGVPALVCYGQPGSSWAPQAVAALGDCGISDGQTPCYLDSGTHVGFGGIPFWYAGALMVYDMAPNETRMDLFDPGAPAVARARFTAIRDRLAAQGGGLISIYYHPCEWVHEQFWDSVNFRRGANPPREQWKPPGQRPAEQTAAAFDRFAAYVDYMRAQPGVRFVTPRDLPALYPDDLRAEGASDEDLLAVARLVIGQASKGLDDVTVGPRTFSPAEQFELLALAVAREVDADAAAPATRRAGPRANLSTIPGLLGPDAAPPPPRESVEPLAWPAFRDAVVDARDFLRTQRRIPARVFIGPDPIPPADLVPAMAAALLARHDAGRFPATVDLGRGVEVLTAARVAKDAPGLFGGWIIHRANFRAPKLLDVARLQAWTLKSASLRGPRGNASLRDGG